MLIFNKQLLTLRRLRAAKNFHEYDFLFSLAAENIADRLQDSSREFFTILELGARKGILQSQIGKKFENYISTNLTTKMLAGNTKIVADSELLPFAANSFDLVLSILDLHHSNDLPGALAQIRHVLKTNGIFIAAILGGKTLHELRQVMLEAELAITGGVSPHIAPFADSSDIAALMQRVGYTMIVVDSDIIEVNYNNTLKLMHDLRYMGEANCLVEQNKLGLSRNLLAKIEELYQQNYPAANGGIKASFEIIYMTGIKP